MEVKKNIKVIPPISFEEERKLACPPKRKRKGQYRAIKNILAYK
jgi:hypothetical protein